MAKIKPRQAYAKEVLSGFPGISCTTGAFSKSAADLRNFRVLPDGSLEKRCGWRVLHSLPDVIRGFWQGTLHGKEFTFAVAESEVFRLGSDTRVSVGSVSDAATGIRFFAYRERLYLLDGTSVQVYDPESDSLEGAQGYVPLYGQNWHPSAMGAVHEDLNLLSDRLRIHYFNATASTTFQLPFYVSTTDSVRVDGMRTTDYTVSGKLLQIPSASGASSIEVALTVSIPDTLRTQLAQTTLAYHAFCKSREQLLLYGAPKGNLLFCATQVSEDMLFASRAEYSDSDALYFTRNAVQTLGDEDHPLTTLFSNHDRILVFHREGAYSLALAENGNPIGFYPLLHGVGCTAPNTALYQNGDPIVINAGGIFRLHSAAADRDEFQITAISPSIPALQTPSFLQGALVCDDPTHGELWFCDPEDEDGAVWIYQVAQGYWTVFDNINPSLFFHSSAEVGFASQGRICLFDESLGTDNGTPFLASYRSAYLDLETPEARKRALRITLCAATDGSDVALTVSSEVRSKSFSLRGRIQNAPVFYDLRAALGRFRFLQVQLHDSGQTRSRFYRLALFANL